MEDLCAECCESDLEKRRDVLMSATELPSDICSKIVHQSYQHDILLVCCKCNSVLLTQMYAKLILKNVPFMCRTDGNCIVTDKGFVSFRKEYEGEDAVPIKRDTMTTLKVTPESIRCDDTTFKNESAVLLQYGWYKVINDDFRVCLMCLMKEKKMRKVFVAWYTITH